MKRYQYIKPDITILGMKAERLLNVISKPDTEDNTGGGESGPGDGGTGGSSDLAKKFDVWGTWGDDFEQ